ncbi:hypothetical protein BN137_3306 [Cronobacter condimenti 1330]|uniref:Uncharacterized protein n=1 Tax=Cronobacter condimenti 1330 TaxID=1073999 RepID=K8AI39_9ENTR|nr:hypothetical protein [Cronobacter condimenti]CCJ73917.1 hypothetical protein BN137_3306 [Cronobacter condimenti 1330]
MATLSVTLLVGCIPYPRERPGYIDLCKRQYEFNVDSPNGKQDIILETYLYDHAIPGNYMPEKQGNLLSLLCKAQKHGLNFMCS